MNDEKANIFDTPSDPEPEPVIIEYHEYSLRLIAEHSLWGHVLWNASKTLAGLVESGRIDVRDKSVLELGAGAALPSIQAYFSGASKVVASDFPEVSIIENIRVNARNNNAEIEAIPLLWGNVLEEEFDLVFLCDLVFNHNEHENLIKTMISAMRDTTEAHCLFSHHLPHKKERDLVFIQMCKEYGLKCQEQEKILAGRMFPQDDEQFKNYPVADRENVFWWIITK